MRPQRERERRQTVGLPAQVGARGALSPPPAIQGAAYTAAPPSRNSPE
jgi:hypothetical protein